MSTRRIISSYEQLTIDTKFVARWLGATAIECGYPADRLPNIHDKPGWMPKYIITTPDFVTLAEFIAASTESPATVPKFFTKTLDRVIAMRSKYSAEVRKEKAVVDADSDARHDYFVGILEKVRGTLKPLAPAVRIPPPSTIVEEEDTLPTNAFTNLELHEPSQAFLDAPDVERPETTSSDNACYEVELPTTDEDLITAYGMMVDDLNNLRRQVLQVWTLYDSGDLDLAAAAISTNTAVDLARTLTENVNDLCETYAGGLHNLAYDHFSLYLQTTIKLSRNEVERHECPDDPFNLEHYDLANHGYLIAHVLLRHLEPLCTSTPKKSGIIPFCNGQTFTSPSYREQMSSRDKFAEDKVVTISLFTDAAIAIRRVNQYPVEDGLMRGFEEMLETGEAPFHLVFALQVHLDIHHLLGEKTASGSETMMRQMDAMAAEIDSFVAYHEKHKDEVWNPEDYVVLETIRKGITDIRADFIHPKKLKLAKKNGVTLDPSDSPHALLRHSPVIAGLMLYHFRTRMYEIGLIAANSAHIVAIAAHLYNALEHEKLVTDQWKEMEITKTWFGENFFVGEPPKTKKDYMKQYMLKIGTSVTSLIPPSSRRRTNDIARRGVERQMIKGLPVSLMFRDRFVDNDLSMNWTAEDVEMLVSRSKSLPQDNTSISPRQSQETPTTPADIVHTLAYALQAEVREMAWPLLSMQMQSWKLLQNVKTSCEKAAPVMIPSGSEKLGLIVGAIFGSAMRNDEGPMKAAAKTMGIFLQVGYGEEVLKMVQRIGVGQGPGRRP